MKKMFVLLPVLLLFMGTALAESKVLTGEIYTTTNGYSLTLLWEQNDMPDRALLEDIQNLYFQAYPPMRETYGTISIREVTIILLHESDMPQGIPAYAAGQEITCSREFLQAARGNLNCIVHELFHVVQNGYPGMAENPLISVLCEGMADVARYDYSVFHDPDWFLPAYTPGQSYMDSYRVTAAFLRWICDTFDEDFCIRLNRLLHEGFAPENLFEAVTEYSLEDLWFLYSMQ